MITAERLRVALDGVELRAAVSFGVGSGDALAVTGPNDSGKTPLPSVLAWPPRPEPGSLTSTASLGVLLVVMRAYDIAKGFIPLLMNPAPSPAGDPSGLFVLTRTRRRARVLEAGTPGVETVEHQQ
ncbi:hypothetical protein I2485_04270 [Nesterenkonia sp. E16_7]|uniref:hypothetical protein n=1 Tax=unclassified Nesterenkonia TaxID=2629769 RepID=UPI001A918EF0|nr:MULTISPECIES: hypothetical protein [unclassified Nesterenkonia]MBO0596515.1 hypothetical protein [Nesterenkonia sp. E16_10]MBO0597861.1 hypothetical protein [Nesterenkonia sp. E16_7]